MRTVTALNDGLDDTVMEAGGESYVNALSYYNPVKQAAKINVPGAKSIYDDLKKRFEKTKSGNGDSTPSAGKKQKTGAPHQAPLFLAFLPTPKIPQGGTSEAQT